MSKVVPLEGFGGGGTPLNFKIVAYATEEELAAAQPKENTIGIVTTNDITSWIFSATEPENPMESMIWILTGTSSGVEFNALKKNGIQVCPVFAKQYISGAWVDMDVMIYQNGRWAKLIPEGALYLPDGYNGEWIGKASWTSSSTYIKAPTISDVDGVLKIEQSTGNYRGTAYNDTLINFSEKKKLTVEWDIDGDSGSTYGIVIVENMEANPYTSLATLVSDIITTGYETQELDVSGVGNIDAYVGVRAYAKTSGTITVKVKRLIVE